ncbi:MAG: integral rane protein [Nocardioidaceae bacterium]|nr:integral rane protein [Nocardioidaceae bacterium]
MTHRLLSRAAWVSASLAPVAMIGGWTLAATRQPAAYDATRDTISALAAHDATDRWIMTAGIATLGVCHVVTALGLEEAAPAGRALLGLGGVTAVGVAVFAQPSSLHFPVATASFVALAAWPAFSRTPSRRTAVVASVGLAALLVWFGAGLDVEGNGLRERVVAGAESLWPLAALVLVRRPSAGSPSPSNLIRRSR